MGMFRQPTQASQAIAILTISLQLIFPVSTQLLKRQISNCLRSFQHKTYRHITAGSPTGYQQTADCWSTVGRWSADTFVCNITKTVGRQLAVLTVRMIYSPIRTVCPSVQNFYSSVRTADQTVQITPFERLGKPFEHFKDRSLTIRHLCVFAVQTVFRQSPLCLSRSFFSMSNIASGFYDCKIWILLPY